MLYTDGAFPGDPPEGENHLTKGFIMRKIVYLIPLLVALSVASASAQRLAVTSSTANVRSGPGTEFDVIWKVEMYHPIVVKKKQGNWYFFADFEGDEAWIHKSLAGKVEAVISIKTNCNVRSGPGTKFDVLFTVDKGIPFKVLKKKGSWLNVAHADGDEGWLHKSLVW